MNRSRLYLVTFRPIGPFFFGGRQEARDATARDYLVHSRHFPQQTGLLGALRHCFLIQAGLADDSGRGGAVKLTQAATRLVGEKGFVLNAAAKCDFGVIDSLGPVFLVDQATGKHWQPGPLCAGMALEYAPALASASVGHAMLAPRLTGYEAKVGLKYQLVTSEPNQTGMDYDKVFVPQEQVGILKGNAGKTESDAYYKQTFYQLQQGFAFACFLRLAATNDLAFEPETMFMNMGAERSKFKVSFTEVEAVQRPLFQASQLPADSHPKLILIADSLVPATAMQHCRFAIAETVDFKFLSTVIGKTERYNHLSRDGKDGQARLRSGQHHLLARGSVLYPSDRDTLVGLLNKAHLQQIGFNHFIEILADGTSVHHPKTL